MKVAKRKKNNNTVAFSMVVVGAGLALVAAGAWYLWFSGSADVTDEQLREIEAFDEYERQRAHG